MVGVVGNETARCGASRLRSAVRIAETVAINVRIVGHRGVHHHAHVLAHVAAAVAHCNGVVAGSSTGNGGIGGCTVGDDAHTRPGVVDRFRTGGHHTQVQGLVAADGAVAAGARDLHGGAGSGIGQ